MRELHLRNPQEVRDELDRLHDGGYLPKGNWNLSQMCEHLADWMTYPLDGFPKAPWFVRALLGVIRKLSGRKMYQEFVAKQAMRPNQPTIALSVHNDVGDESRSIARLKAAMSRLESHTGFIHPSPLFGALTKDELLELQLAHCAHHLRFLEPKS